MDVYWCVCMLNTLLKFAVMVTTDWFCKTLYGIFPEGTVWLRSERFLKSKQTRVYWQTNHLSSSWIFWNWGSYYGVHGTQEYFKMSVIFKPNAMLWVGVCVCVCALFLRDGPCHSITSQRNGGGGLGITDLKLLQEIWCSGRKKMLAGWQLCHLAGQSNVFC